ENRHTVDASASSSLFPVIISTVHPLPIHRQTLLLKSLIPLARLFFHQLTQNNGSVISSPTFHRCLKQIKDPVFHFLIGIRNLPNLLITQNICQSIRAD